MNDQKESYDVQLLVRTSERQMAEIKRCAREENNKSLAKFVRDAIDYYIEHRELDHETRSCELQKMMFVLLEDEDFKREFRKRLND